MQKSYVIGSSMVLTRIGLVSIKGLYDFKDRVEIWDGYEWFIPTINKIKQDDNLVIVGTNKLYRVICSESSSIKTTKNMELKDILSSSRAIGIKEYKLPIIDGKIELKKSYMNGYFQSEVLHRRNYDGNIFVYDYLFRDEDFKNYMAEIPADYEKIPYNYCGLDIGAYFFNDPDILNLYQFPYYNYTLQSRINYMSGFFNNNATYIDEDNFVTYMTDGNVMQGIGKVLNSLGCSYNIRIYQTQTKHVNFFKYESPHIIRREERATVYRFTIGNNDITKLARMGVKIKKHPYLPTFNKNELTVGTNRDRIKTIESCSANFSELYYVEGSKNNTCIFNNILFNT